MRGLRLGALPCSLKVLSLSLAFIACSVGYWCRVDGRLVSACTRAGESDDGTLAAGPRLLPLDSALTPLQSGVPYLLGVPKGATKLFGTPRSIIERGSTQCLTSADTTQAGLGQQTHQPPSAYKIRSRGTGHLSACPHQDVVVQCVNAQR